MADPVEAQKRCGTGGWRAPCRARAFRSSQLAPAGTGFPCLVGQEAPGCYGKDVSRGGRKKASSCLGWFGVLGSS
jgi:hypothetical protein